MKLKTNYEKPISKMIVFHQIFFIHQSAGPQLVHKYACQLLKFRSTPFQQEASMFCCHPTPKSLFLPFKPNSNHFNHSQCKF